MIEKKNKRIKKKLYKFTIVSLLDETEGKDIIFLLKFVYVKKEKKKVRRRKTQNGWVKKNTEWELKKKTKCKD